MTKADELYSLSAGTHLEIIEPNEVTIFNDFGPKHLLKGHIYVHIARLLQNTTLISLAKIETELKKLFAAPEIYYAFYRLQHKGAIQPYIPEIPNQIIGFSNLLDLNPLDCFHRLKNTVLSTTYLEGLYEYVLKDRAFKKLPKDIDNFLKVLDEIHNEICQRLSSFLSLIRRKTEVSTSIKVWRHLFMSGSIISLPVHFDRSIFSVITHTKSPGEECLRIFPNKGLKEESWKGYPPFPLTESDFPLILAGNLAHKYFDIYPTPHYVAQGLQDAKVRYSLMSFIDNNKHN